MRRRRHGDGASRPGAGPGRHPGHRRDAAGPRPRRLVELASHPRWMGVQPARPDRPEQRGRAAARLVLGPRARGVADDAARARRRHVCRKPGQRGPRPRRAHGRLPVGVPPRDGRAAPERGADAQPCRLPGPGHPEHRRRARRRAGRPDRRGALGHAGRRRPGRLHLLERTDRRRWDHHRRHDRLRALPRRHLLHRRRRRPHRPAAVADLDHRPPRRDRRRHLGRPAAHVPRGERRVDDRQLRPGHRARLLGHVAAQAAQPRRARHRRRRALQQLDARPRPRDGRDGVVLPAHPRRFARHGRVVRAHPGRLRRPALAVHDGQARHSLGARPRHRRVPARESISAIRTSSMSTPRPAR